MINIIEYAIPQTIYRVAKKNKSERQTSHNMWMQSLVSVYEVYEKNYTKIYNFGSIVSFLGHILPDNIKAANFLFPA